MVRGLQLLKLSFFLLLVVISSCSFATEARKLQSKGMDGFFNGLAIKNSGPSPGGEGHKSVNAYVGHKIVDTKTLEGIKVSGPSPGGSGHKSVNAQTLDGIKGSGSMQHKFATNVELLEGAMKRSGSSPGQGH